MIIYFFDTVEAQLFILTFLIIALRIAFTNPYNFKKLLFHN